MEKIEALAKKLQIRFKEPALLKQALVHRSYLNEHRSFELPHNERLEFLGDAVLELIVTDHLYRKYKEPEGVLTSWRSALVRGERLAKVASEFGVGDAILMSRGEEKSGGRGRNVLLANAFEAIIGAVYLDSGYDAANDLVHRVLIPVLPEIIANNLDQDAKSRLQEISQQKFGITPNYEVVEESGPDHDKHFTIGVYLEKNKVGQGEGASKQQGEQAAAEDALTSEAFTAKGTPDVS